jgi:hypothetical protein
LAENLAFAPTPSCVASLTPLLYSPPCTRHCVMCRSSRSLTGSGFAPHLCHFPICFNGWQGTTVACAFLFIYSATMVLLLDNVQSDPIFIFYSAGCRIRPLNLSPTLELTVTWNLDLSANRIPGQNFTRLTPKTTWSMGQPIKLHKDSGLLTPGLSPRGRGARHQKPACKIFRYRVI